MPTQKNDADIRDAVLRELAWDSKTADTQVGVQVEDGVVTLGGTVHNWAMRNAAAAAAHRVAAVKDVANDLQVVPPKDSDLSDTGIAKAVRQILEWDALIPDRSIRSTVGMGVVTLEGNVTTQMERDEAEQAVARLRGVRRVDNRLRIERHPMPEVIETSIFEALARRALREGTHLKVMVHDSAVRIEGTVQSADERRAVLGAVRGTRGVQVIEDFLSVDEKGRRNQ
jgi:osmotically-inducible protein OsmY